MRLTEIEQHESSLITRCRGRDGVGCIGRPGHFFLASLWPLPGFQAYPENKDRAGEGRALPGFRARSYRDWGHTPVGGRYQGHTGISGMPLPGMETHSYREVGHTRAGTWGTNEPASTGIPGTYWCPNPVKALGKRAGNSVSNNSCNNSPTRGDAFRFKGRGR